jgi:hypothetical protein
LSARFDKTAYIRKNKHSLHLKKVFDGRFSNQKTR